ncbi:hypothetical protein GGS20DRAFT_498763 [Poronia punctata]|nr:hypothetical protein GGS20DRAFT_498763 [Poronia punctata]
MAQQQPIFGLLPAGQPLITTPTSQPNPTSFLYLIPSTTPTNPKPFNHLAVFLLPGISLPENTAAAIYVASDPSAFAPGRGGSAEAGFRFLGGVGSGKESAVFKLGGSNNNNNNNNNNNSVGEGGVVIGIDIENATTVAQKIQQAQQQQAQSSTTALVRTGTGTATGTGPGTGTGLPENQVVVLVLAQRIIQNAFNFLSSFSGQVENGVEVVPLRAFHEWWRKFEAKIKMDPGFLERGQD